MARRSVVEVECSRCDRKELRDEPVANPAANPKGHVPALLVRFSDGTKIEFEDLCEPCMSAVKGHLDAVGKKITGLSPARKKDV